MCAETINPYIYNNVYKQGWVLPRQLQGVHADEGFRESIPAVDLCVRQPSNSEVSREVITAVRDD